MPRFLSAVLLCLTTMAAQAGDAQIAVAANFSAPAKRIAEAFEHASGHKATLVTGATGKFHAQIVNGAPFDVLLAADDDTREAGREGTRPAAFHLRHRPPRAVECNPRPCRLATAPY